MLPRFRISCSNTVTCLVNVWYWSHVKHTGKNKRSINFISKFLWCLTWLHVLRFHLFILDKILAFFAVSAFIPWTTFLHRLSDGLGSSYPFMLNSVRNEIPQRNCFIKLFFLNRLYNLFPFSQNNFNKILLKGLNKCIFENILT